MKTKICLITGVGPGTGTQLVKRFADAGYIVAMLARSKKRLQALENEIDNAHAYLCDVSDREALSRVIASIKSDFGLPDVIIHNAYAGALGDILQIKPKTIELNFQVNTMALLHTTQLVAEDMVARGSGAILCTGNTSAYRGKANFASFAPTKAAQRILAESIARRLGPEGIHVAYIMIDAVIDVPWARAAFPDAKDDFFCSPEHIAEECFRVAHQPKSAWSFNVEIRPYCENW